MVTIRPEAHGDAPAVAAVTRAAFGGPAEAILVDRLRAAGLVIASLVADDEGAIVGHVLFSRVSIEGNGRPVAAASLAPMAVAPARQRQGIGSRLVEEGLDRCRAAGERIVVVVGHPEYYPRFGFSAEAASRLRNPYAAGASFMALELTPGALAGVSGAVTYPPAFDGL